MAQQEARPTRRAGLLAQTKLAFHAKGGEGVIPDAEAAKKNTKAQKKDAPPVVEEEPSSSQSDTSPAKGRSKGRGKGSAAEGDPPAKRSRSRKSDEPKATPPAEAPQEVDDYDELLFARKPAAK
jgi:hypothetical protein